MEHARSKKKKAWRLDVGSHAPQPAPTGQCRHSPAESGIHTMGPGPRGEPGGTPSNELQVSMTKPP